MRIKISGSIVFIKIFFLALFVCNIAGIGKCVKKNEETPTYSTFYWLHPITAGYINQFIPKSIVKAKKPHYNDILKELEVSSQQNKFSNIIMIIDTLYKLTANAGNLANAINDLIKELESKEKLDKSDRTYINKIQQDILKFKKTLPDFKKLDKIINIYEAACSFYEKDEKFRNEQKLLDSLRFNMNNLRIHTKQLRKKNSMLSDANKKLTKLINDKRKTALTIILEKHRNYCFP